MDMEIIMNKYILSSTILSGLIVTGCGTTPEVKNMTVIGVDYNWLGDYECKRISPEIRLSNVPKGTTLLKVANSAMFGFRHAVESPSRAISLLGVNFTISVALGSIVQDFKKANLFRKSWNLY